jgi:hypothetical protein
VIDVKYTKAPSLLGPGGIPVFNGQLNSISAPTMNPSKSKPHVGTNARGTSYWRGGPTWVGENGPELVSLPQGSQVLNAARSRQLVGAGVGAGASVKNEQNTYIDKVIAHDYNDFRRQADERARRSSLDGVRG